MLQITLIKVMLAVMVYSLVVFGLTSHAFSFRQRQFYNSYVLTIYSLVIILLFTYVYGSNVLNELLENPFDIKNGAKIYRQINVLASMVSYGTAFLLSRKLVRFLNNTKLIETMNYFDIRADLAKSAVRVVGFKAVVFPFISEIALVIQHLHNNPDQYLLWTLYPLMPMIISQLLPNCLFFGMVNCKMITYALNTRLNEIVKEVNCMQTDLQMKLQKSYYRMQRFCDLADKIDILAEIYDSSCKQMDRYLQLMSVPLLCSLLCNVWGITAGFYIQYNAIADTLVNEEPFDVYNALTNAVFLTISVMDVILLAHICEGNCATIQETGVILQRVRLVHADVRFKQTVETFSLHILLTKYKIQPLYMLEVNISTVGNVFSAVSSFLLIFIQSDLTLRFSLK